MNPRAWQILEEQDEYTQFLYIISGDQNLTWTKLCREVEDLHTLKQSEKYKSDKAPTSSAAA